MTGSMRTSDGLREPTGAMKLDAERLALYMVQQGLIRPGATVEVKQVSHGQSNPTYLVTVEQGRVRLVLRKKPPGKLLPSAHQIEREYAVIHALGATGVPVPRARCLCEDSQVIGTPFMIMEFVDGRIEVDPALPTRSPAERSRIYASMADALAALHSVDPARVGLSSFGKAEGYCARQVARWSKQYAASMRAVGKEVPPDVLRLAKWLSSHTPPDSARPCVSHGDFRLDNLVLDATGSVMAILDWELSTLGDPLADLAYACLPYHLPEGLPHFYVLPGGGSRPARGAALPQGIPEEHGFVAQYFRSRAQRSGGNVAAEPPAKQTWAFYVALALFRVAAILAGVHARAAAGSASSAYAREFASLTSIEKITARALEVVAASGAGAAEAEVTGGVAMGLGPPEGVRELLGRVRAFIDGELLPREAELIQHSKSDQRWEVPGVLEDLKARAREQGLWNLWISAPLAREMAAGVPELAGSNPDSRLLLGPGLTNYEYAYIAAETGRVHHYGAEIFNCSAPDTGNMEVLGRYGTPQQKQQWLLPLLRGDIRSCFAMTEPAVASSDATNIRATVTADPLDPSSVVLNGRKWWTSGAADPRTKICIFMGRGGPDADSAPPHKRHSMCLVEMATPGVRVVRHLSVFGFDDAPHGHAEVEFDNVRVPASNLVLGHGRGFEIAQGRLGPGRLHHCMRLVGLADRALELCVRRAKERSTFGKKLVEHGSLRHSLANARVDLEGARLLVLRAAAAIDAVGAKRARGVVAEAKVAAPRAALAAIDVAIQVHGGMGVSSDTPLAHAWAAARTLRLADGPDEVHLDSLARREIAGRASRL
ncbi:unnamed protein product [Pedinophyceae sp. YPF-701]|nr:unnamed protein product [Pedinophyceae sp. YPF-701]